MRLRTWARVAARVVIGAWLVLVTIVVLDTARFGSHSASRLEDVIRAALIAAAILVGLLIYWNHHRRFVVREVSRMVRSVPAVDEIADAVAARLAPRTVIEQRRTVGGPPVYVARNEITAEMPVPPTIVDPDVIELASRVSSRVRRARGEL